MKKSLKRFLAALGVVLMVATVTMPAALACEPEPCGTSLVEFILGKFSKCEKPEKPEKPECKLCTGTITYETNGGVFALGAPINYTFVKGQKTDLPTADMIYKEDGLFTGWFTNKCFAGCSVDAVPACYFGCDFKVYARWANFALHTYYDLDDTEIDQDKFSGFANGKGRKLLRILEDGGVPEGMTEAEAKALWKTIVSEFAGKKETLFVDHTLESVRYDDYYDEDKELVEAALKDGESISDVFDMFLLRTIASSDGKVLIRDEAVDGTLNEAYNVTFALGKEKVQDKDIRVLTVEDGNVVEVTPVAVDEENGKISFAINSLGKFIVVSADKPIEPPVLGIEQDLFPYTMGIATMALTALAAVLVLRRREN